MCQKYKLLIFPFSALLSKILLKSSDLFYIKPRSLLVVYVCVLAGDGGDGERYFGHIFYPHKSSSGL